MIDDIPIKKWNLNTKYDRNFHPDLAVSVFSQGLDIPSVCAKALISRETYYAWYNTHPEFKEACDVGRQMGESWWDAKASEHTVIITEKDGPKVTFNEGVYKFVKKATYKARESDPTTVIVNGSVTDEKIQEAIDLVASLHKKDT